MYILKIKSKLSSAWGQQDTWTRPPSFTLASLMTGKVEIFTEK